MVNRERRPSSTSEPRIGLRLSQDLRQAIKALALEDGRSLSSYVARVLADHVRQKTGGMGGKKKSAL
jgi:hypothetical protein